MQQPEGAQSEMKEYSNISRIYFIGIGGIGMSALARYYRFHNVTVSGYDKTPTPLTFQMEDQGIHIHYEDNEELLDREAQLVVYTPAVPKDHKELNYYLRNNYTVIKRSALLGTITRTGFNICIGGTHGKTTISTMVAHILRDSGYGCTAFLGGISGNYQTNFWSSNRNVFVIEADEYDRSFLELLPDIALISAMDPDHLDIYGTAENMENAFVEFSKKVKPGGLLVTKWNLGAERFSASNYLRYSLMNPESDVYASDITTKNGTYQFNVINQGATLQGVVLKMGGMHNIENAVAAIVIAMYLKIDSEKIVKAIGTFRGVKRRFEYVVGPDEQDGGAQFEGTALKARKIIYIDDYAHHPEELRALILGAKGLFPERKCTVIFQPHLFSRTRDLAEGFARALDMADEIILMPIYPARELPMEGVSSATIARLMQNPHQQILSREGVMDYVKNSMAHSCDPNSQGELLVTAGAGNIDTLVEPIKNILLANQG